MMEAFRRSCLNPSVLARVGLHRRACVRTIAVAGLLFAGMVGFTVSAASAEPCITTSTVLRRWNQVNANFLTGPFVVTSQNGSNFSGTIFGESMTGTITGNSAGGGQVTVVFVRRLASGEPQIYTGAYRETGGGTCSTNANGAMMMSGVFYHHGEGPSPWFVTGSYGALSPR